MDPLINTENEPEDDDQQEKEAQEKAEAEAKAAAAPANGGRRRRLRRRPPLRPQLRAFDAQDGGLVVASHVASPRVSGGRPL